jgi:hypothetical protein
MAFRKGEQNKSVNIYVVDDEDDGIPINAATTKQFVFRKPSGAESTVTATFISGGTGGGLTYVIDATTFLDESGDWKVQAIVSGTGFVWKSAWGSFPVEDNL